MNSVLITPPATEPVTLAETKAHLRVEHSADDAVITTLISAARQWAEVYLRRALITQTWQLSLNSLPERLELPKAPLQSITHVKTFDAADVASVVSASVYQADTATTPGALVLRTGAVWPDAGRNTNRYEVHYVAGYGTAASSVPAPIRQGLLQHIAALYENRGDETPPALSLALYAPYRVLR